MDRKMARKNMQWGIALFIVVLALLGATFVWATVYLNAVR